MANELNAVLDPESDAGLTVVAQLYTNAGAQVGADVACSEAGTTAIYVGDMPTAAAGVYTVRFLSGSTCVAQGIIEWDGSAEITGVSLNTAAQATLADTDELQQNQGNFATATGFTVPGDLTGLATSAEVGAINPATAAEIATAVQAAIIDEGDGQQVIDAILQVFNANLDLPALELTAIAQAVRGEISTELGRLDAAVSTRSTLAAGDVATAVAGIAVEAGLTLADVNRLVLAAVAGKGGSLNGTDYAYRDVADTKDRITAVTDGTGNRTSVTLDAS